MRVRSTGWLAGLVAMGVVGGLIAEEVKQAELPKKFIRMTMNLSLIHI